jgi:hypothetical protein
VFLIPYRIRNYETVKITKPKGHKKDKCPIRPLFPYRTVEQATNGSTNYYTHNGKGMSSKNSQKK